MEVFKCSKWWWLNGTTRLGNTRWFTRMYTNSLKNPPSAHTMRWKCRVSTSFAFLEEEMIVVTGCHGKKIFWMSFPLCLLLGCCITYCSVFQFSFPLPRKSLGYWVHVTTISACVGDTPENVFHASPKQWNQKGKKEIGIVLYFPHHH